MSSQRGEPIQDSTWLIENARIVTPEAVIEGAIRIEGDRIVDIGDSDTLV